LVSAAEIAAVSTTDCMVRRSRYHMAESSPRPLMPRITGNPRPVQIMTPPPVSRAKRLTAPANRWAGLIRRIVRSVSLGTIITASSVHRNKKIMKK
jgi:hypothetical protein